MTAIIVMALETADLIPLLVLLRLLAIEVALLVGVTLYLCYLKGRKE